MQPVKTGIIGLGYWGPNLLRTFSADPMCHVAYGCDLNTSLQEKAKAHHPAVMYTANADELFQDPSLELIAIATPTSSHFELARLALEAGKHVLLEKPMASTSDQAKTLNVLAEQKGRHIFVDHTFVFAPAVEKMANMVASDQLGSLLYFDSVRMNLGIIQKDVNVLFDLAIHDLSILSTIQNLDDIRSVLAIGNKYFGKQEEVAHLHLNFRSGFHAHIQVSWLSPVKIRQTILSGTKAMVVYDDTQTNEKLRIYDRGVEHDTTKPDPFFPVYRSGDTHIPLLPTVEPLANEVRNIWQTIRGMGTAKASGSDGQKILQILELANKSMAMSTSLPLSA